MPTINDREFSQELFDSVTITPEAIEEEFARLPGDLAYWNAQYADAVNAHLKAQADYKKCRAEMRLSVREQLIADGVKPTESMVESNVEVQVDYVDAAFKVVETEAEKVRLFGVVDSVRAKRDMLQSLGKHVLLEKEYDASVRDMGRQRSRAARDGQ